MIYLIDQLIASLTELRSMSLLIQIATAIGVVGPVITVLSLPAFLMRRKVKDAVAQFEIVRNQRDTSVAETAKLNAQLQKLEDETPSAFLKKVELEQRDGNIEAVMELSEGFIEQHKAALETAMRVRVQEAIGQSVVDGAPAFNTASNWAKALLALTPRDRTLHLLIADLAAAEDAAASSNFRTKLKDQEDQKQRLERYERLPSDLTALTVAFREARDGGRLHLAFVLVEHGVALTKRHALGVSAQDSLWFRLFYAEAFLRVGRLTEAKIELQNLNTPIQKTFGNSSKAFFYYKKLCAECDAFIGDYKKALAEIEAIIPTQSEVMGARDREVLISRADRCYYVCLCGDPKRARDEMFVLKNIIQEEFGSKHIEYAKSEFVYSTFCLNLAEYEAALKSAKENLSINQENFGKKHPLILNLRQLIANIYGQIGKISEAAVMLEELLPDQEQVFGNLHPFVVDAKCTLADYRGQLGELDRSIGDMSVLIPQLTDLTSPHHLDVFEARISMLKLLKLNGDFETGLLEANSVLNDAKNTFGEHHPCTFDAEYWRIIIEMNLGKHEIALVALRQLLERRRKIEGELYPGTLRIRVLIAECLEALGDLAGASVEIANVKDSFLASGMLPEHPAVRDVENLESRIARKQTDD